MVGGGEFSISEGVRLNLGQLLPWIKSLGLESSAANVNAAASCDAAALLPASGETQLPVSFVSDHTDYQSMTKVMVADHGLVASPLRYLALK